jgi:hypothetical protein
MPIGVTLIVRGARRPTRAELEELISREPYMPPGKDGGGGEGDGEIVRVFHLEFPEEGREGA